MPPHALLEGAVGLHATVDESLRWTVSTIARLTFGSALGVAAANIMRSRHLHWRWAAAALAMFVLARTELASTEVTLTSAALIAAARSRHWHREDIEAGSDLAELAARRHDPLKLMRRLGWTVATRIREHIGAGRGYDQGALPLGIDEDRRSVSIPFGGPGGGTHALVVGATGSGKTVTQASIAAHSIARGLGAVVVDPKGDDGMRDELRRAAALAGRAFVEWTPAGNTVYNPYSRGSASEIADKALAGERFTEPHYLRQAQRYLGHVVRALRGTGAEVSLRAIVEHLQPERLELVARRLPQADARATFAYLDSLSKRQQSELAGVRDRLAILAESDIGPWLDPRTTGARFELLSALSDRAVVYFALESDSRPLLSQMLGGAIIQDLQTTVASLQASPVPTLVVIDEFSAIAADQVVRLFGRARSAGFSLLLGTQELSDLRLPGHERLLEQVLGNLSVLIAHRQVVPDSAELIARIAGTRGTWRVSRNSDGRTTRTRSRAPVLEAGQVMSLGRAWAAVLVLGDGASARMTRISAPAQRR